MQIHELNNYSGSIGDAYLAADNGSDTGKMKTTALTDPLNARIDNIIAGPAPSAAEIVDARLGADEVTYPSLGAAIRDQVTDLKGDLVETNSDLINLSNLDFIPIKMVWEKGGIDNDTGLLNHEGSLTRSRDITAYKISSYIKVKNNSNVALWLLYYGNEKLTDFQGSYKVEPKTTFELPTNYNYVRFDLRGSLEESKNVTLFGFDYKLLKEINQHESRIAILEEKSYKIPTYYKNHLENKTSEIRNNMMDGGKNSETFVFITDIHWDNNDKNSPALVEYLFDRLNINTIICGGDIINEGERGKMAQDMNECVKLFNFKNSSFSSAFGNHDSNENEQSEYPDRWFDRNALYALMFKQNGNLANYLTEDDWTFFIDKYDSKTRFIFLDTGKLGYFKQFDALHKATTSVNEGWKIVIVAHWLYNDAWYQVAYDLRTYVDEYNARGLAQISTVSKQYDCSNSKGEIVTILGGHTHYDLDWSSEKGVPIIITDSDNGVRSHNADYPYQKGTVNEQCFDVITIDYTKRTVKCVRIGRGADRAYTY